MQRWQHIMKLIAVAVLFGAGIVLQAQEEAGLERVVTLSFPNTRSEMVPGFDVKAVDVWADGDVAAVSSGPLVHLVDLNNMDEPAFHTIELGQGNESWDVKLKGNFLYVGLQNSANGDPLVIYDVSDIANPVEIGRFQTDEFAGTHNLFVVDQVVFLVSLRTGLRDGEEMVPPERSNRLWMVDVSDPTNPKSLGPVLDTNTGEAITRNHDLTVIGNRAYIAAWVNGIYILDFENLDDPQNLTYETIAHHKYDPVPDSRSRNAGTFPNPATHNLWPSEDGTVLWSTDEVVGEAVRVFDISNLEDIRLIDAYRLDVRAMPHNVFVQGDFAYVAHYVDGLRVLQLTNEGIVEVARHDTIENNPRGNPFRGAFGIFPLEHHVLISDTFNGLLIFEKQGVLNQ